ncbi:MAG: hypothetical protein ABSG78_01690 [Verrucomicrobiota bacterium]|jgi:hypothetical protein
MREKFRGAHAPSRVVAGALAGHIFSFYTLDIEPAKRGPLGSAAVPPAAFGVPPNALQLPHSRLRRFGVLVNRASQCYFSSMTAVLQKVEALTKTVERLQERVEDLEDLRDSQAAIAENGQEQIIPWEQAKVALDIV